MATHRALQRDDIVDVLNTDGKRILYGVIVHRDREITILKQLVYRSRKPYWFLEISEVPTCRFIFNRVAGLRGEVGILTRFLLQFVSGELMVPWTSDPFTGQIFYHHNPSAEEMLPDIIRTLLLRRPSSLREFLKRRVMGAEPLVGGEISRQAAALFRDKSTTVETACSITIAFVGHKTPKVKEAFLASATRIGSPHIAALSKALNVSVGALPGERATT